MSAIKMGGGWHFHLKGRKSGKFGGVLVLQQLYGALLVLQQYWHRICQPGQVGIILLIYSILVCPWNIILHFSKLYFDPALLINDHISLSNNQAYPLQLTSLCQRVAPQSLASWTLASPPPPSQVSHQASRCNPEQNQKLQSLLENLGTDYGQPSNGFSTAKSWCACFYICTVKVLFCSHHPETNPISPLICYKL